MGRALFCTAVGALIKIRAVVRSPNNFLLASLKCTIYFYDLGGSAAFSPGAIKNPGEIR